MKRLTVEVLNVVGARADDAGPPLRTYAVARLVVVPMATGDAVQQIAQVFAFVTCGFPQVLEALTHESLSYGQTHDAWREKLQRAAINQAELLEQAAGRMRELAGKLESDVQNVAD